MTITPARTQDLPDPGQVFQSAIRAAHENSANRLCTVRAADSDGRRSSANILVNRMYAWRGYNCDQGNAEGRSQNRITLVATEDDITIGTLTVGFDGADGLLVDDLFRAEVQHMRLAGAALCEFTKLAVDSARQSRAVLASMFHLAFIYAREFNHSDRILIEVNPRHVRYYERMLGFVIQASERTSLRVNAPAVLMSLDLSYARTQIDRFGGRRNVAPVERSMYPFVFSPVEERGIVQRLRTTQH